MTETARRLLMGCGRGWRGMLLIPLVLALVACQEPPPLKIGYVGGLTGRVAGLGVAGRDGVLLAVEEVNRAGGIKGRPVELLTRDDQQQVELARQATTELIDSDVVAIIGPMTSAMAVAMQPLVNQAGVVLMSPTVTTNSLSDQDDYFFRMTVPLSVNAAKTAAYAIANGMARVAVSVDTGNAAYTEDWFESFRETFERDGGKIIHVERFKSGVEGGFLPLAERLLKERPDALLLLSGAMDTAMIAQQVRKLDSPAALLASEWAFTSDVINFGGAAVEGMLSYVTYDPASPTSEHQLFLANFEKRFGYKPSFAAVLGYEAATTLFVGLERKPQREGLKEALLQIGTFAGLQGEVQISRHGDPERRTYLGVIRQGQFATID